MQLNVIVKVPSSSLYYNFYLIFNSEKVNQKERGTPFPFWLFIGNYVIFTSIDFLISLDFRTLMFIFY